MKQWDEAFIEEVIESVDIVEFIGEYVDLERRGIHYFASCPFHDEDTASFCVTPSKHFYSCFGCGEHGNVITFCMKQLDMTYDDAVEYLAGIAGLAAEKQSISSSVSFFKKLKRKNKLIHENPKPHLILDKETLKQFDYGFVKLWQDEGIPQNIMDKYGVGYDRRSQRIVYPVYDNNGNLINIKGRTTVADYKHHDPPIPKYINYQPVGDMDYFQGMNFKKDLIKDVGECILFESFKSVMKADSYGYPNSVSVESHKINKYQVRLLLKLQCDIVIAFDKDVSINEIRNMDTVNKLKMFTNVYVIVDKNNLLGGADEKNSPVDKGKEIWEKLYEEKLRI